MFAHMFNSYTVNFGISEPEGTGKIGSDKPKFVTTEVSGYPNFVELYVGLSELSL